MRFIEPELRSTPAYAGAPRRYRQSRNRFKTEARSGIPDQNRCSPRPFSSKPRRAATYLIKTEARHGVPLKIEALRGLSHQNRGAPWPSSSAPKPNGLADWYKIRAIAFDRF
jgi:hypothetical protein